MMLILCGDGGGNVEKEDGVVVVVAEGGSGFRVFDVVMMTVDGVSEWIFGGFTVDVVVLAHVCVTTRI